MGEVLVQAEPSAVGMVGVPVVGPVGHFVCCCLLFLLPLRVCTAFLCWFGLGYLLLLVVTVLGGCCRF